MHHLKKQPFKFLPVVLFLAVVFGLGAIAVTASLRSYEHIVDLVIKIVAGWAALVMALFGPLVVSLLAFAHIEIRHKKITGVVTAVLAIAVAVWLLRYVSLSIF